VEVIRFTTHALEPCLQQPSYRSDARRLRPLAHISGDQAGHDVRCQVPAQYFLLFLLVAVTSYLALVEGIKRWFHLRYAQCLPSIEQGRPMTFYPAGNDLRLGTPMLSVVYAEKRGGSFLAVVDL
jgi:hypothetical protein